MCGRRARRRKTLAESYSTNQLVLAPHQKDEEEPRRVNGYDEGPVLRLCGAPSVEDGAGRGAPAHRVLAGPRRSDGGSGAATTLRPWCGSSFSSVRPSLEQLTPTRLLRGVPRVQREVAPTVPSFFGGADDEIPCACPLARRPRPPSAENLQMLHNANALDIALYAYAKRFDAHFDACFPR